MIGTFGATPAFDAPFYWSQVATIAVWLPALLRARAYSSQQDLLVAQSINSHHDPKMHAHCSTISDAEKTGALAKAIRLFPSPLEPTTSALPTPSRVADRVADPTFDHAGR
jgi:hypothetical protein